MLHWVQYGYQYATLFCKEPIIFTIIHILTYMSVVLPRAAICSVSLKSVLLRICISTRGHFLHYFLGRRWWHFLEPVGISLKERRCLLLLSLLELNRNLGLSYQRTVIMEPVESFHPCSLPLVCLTLSSARSC